MGYKIKIQLRDTVMEFDKKAARDAKYIALVSGVVKLGIPSDNLIVSKIDTEHSDFLGQDLEKVVE